MQFSVEQKKKKIILFCKTCNRKKLAINIKSIFAPYLSACSQNRIVKGNPSLSKRPYRCLDKARRDLICADNCCIREVSSAGERMLRQTVRQGEANSLNLQIILEIFWEEKHGGGTCLGDSIVLRFKLKKYFKALYGKAYIFNKVYARGWRKDFSFILLEGFFFSLSVAILL